MDLGDFALRYFVGFDACDPGACSDYLVQAKDRLERLFTVVLVLEELEDTGWRDARRLRVALEAEVRRAGTRRGSSAFAELEAPRPRRRRQGARESMWGFEAATGGGGGGGGGGGPGRAPAPTGAARRT